MSLRDRRQTESEAFLPGAKLVWSDDAGKLVLQVPKARPASHATPQPRTSATIIDRLLAAASKD